MIKINQQEIKQFNFHGGECHINIEGIMIGQKTEVIAYLYNSNDIMSLILTVDAIRQINAKTSITLIIPYMPYARQDRVCNRGEAFSASVMAQLINNLHCQKIITYDIHSTIASDLIHNCFNKTITQILEETFLFNQEEFVLISPDQGAEGKVKELSQKFHCEAIYCKKQRNTQTGQIIQTIIPDIDITQYQTKKFLIIDDICDGGSTFVNIAKKLKNQNIHNISLYITHGIFSKGLDCLKEYFNHIYCYHSFLNSNNIDREFLTIFNQ